MNRTKLFGTLLLISILLGGCATTPGSWHDDWRKCALAGGAVGAGAGATDSGEAAAAGAVGGALIGGVLCAVMNHSPTRMTDGDSDGDGVMDSMDRCPRTKPGVPVDNTGCPMQKVTVLKGVNFRHDSSVLTDDSAATLDGAVASLKLNPNLQVEVAGHTDRDGTNEYNVALSQRRANAVMTYLVSHGINQKNLTAVGYGEENPMADNATKEGRAQNRRVELRIK